MFPTRMQNIATVICLSIYAVCSAQQPLNFDFETKSVEGIARPWGWSPFQVAANTSTSLDSSTQYEGRYSLRFQNSKSDDDGSTSEHSLGYWLSPYTLSGKKVMLLGWVRTDKPDGLAMVSLGAYGDTGLISEVKSEAFRGGKGWRQFKLEITEAAPAHSWFLVLSSNGAGSVWFDDFRLLVDGQEMLHLEVADDFTPQQLAWIKNQCTPFSDYQALALGADNGFKDLSALGKAVGNAKIIALGEATHGTSEFFQLKHRLLQYAVQALKVRVFAIEANQLEVEKINAFVKDGIGEANEVIKVMFRVWNTEEMLHLIEWLRAYNLAHPSDKVSFVGFDLQDPSLPMDSLSQFVAQWTPGLRPLIDSLQGEYREAWRAQYYPQAPDSIRAIWKAHAAKTLELVLSYQTNWLAKAKTALEKDRVEWAVQNARVVCQAAEIAYSQSVSGRDTFMAENIRWIASRTAPATRILVWAHDSHIARGDNPDQRYNYHGGNSMGRHLSRIFGDSYKAFGLFTYAGQYSATISYTNHTVVPVPAMTAPRGSLDEALHRIAADMKAKQLFFDLRPALKLKNNEWIMQPRPVRFVGYATADYDFGAMMAIPQQFDGIFFIDRTTASKMLR